MAAAVISFFCVILGLYALMLLHISLWRTSDHRRMIESGKVQREFMGYMKRLRTPEAGKQLLRKFKSLEEVKAANERLKKRYAKSEEN